jgi:hypothetical protein
MSSDDEVQVIVLPWDAPPPLPLPPSSSPPIATNSSRQMPKATNSRRNSLSISLDDEVQVVIPWDAQLKLSPVYEPTFDIFSGGLDHGVHS